MCYQTTCHCEQLGTALKHSPELSHPRQGPRILVIWLGAAHSCFQPFMLVTEQALARQAEVLTADSWGSGQAYQGPKTSGKGWSTSGVCQDRDSSWSWRWSGVPLALLIKGMLWMSACISSLRDALVGGGDPELIASLCPFCQAHLPIASQKGCGKDV